MRPLRLHRGFTLIELMVVIAVVGIMAAILLPALNKAKEQGKATVCRSNMKQIALGFLMYAEDNEEYLPWPGGQPDRSITSRQYTSDWCYGGQTALDPNLASTWDVPGFGFNAECGSVFPYVLSQPRMEYDADFKERYDVFRCPSVGRLGDALRVNFAANGWTDPGKPFGVASGKVPPRGLMTTTVIDPARKILLINEEPTRFTLSPAFVPGNLNRKAQLHLGRANVAFIDGHMETIQGGVFQQWQGRDSDIYFNCGR
ncbi:MAG TPA: prepilin-type N-terminal cleavage/methylation domain-containing protein [Verrucomicrobiae bacterium]|nr:prepilin-type N-terminal cleavage/methylation domain-containing protein [Verrucomicrobiae bacterium]